MVDLHGFFLGSLKSFLAKADSQCFVSGFMVLTIFALFAPDLDLLLGTVQSQHALSYLTGDGDGVGVGLGSDDDDDDGDGSGSACGSFL